MKSRTLIAVTVAAAITVLVLGVGVALLIRTLGGDESAPGGGEDTHTHIEQGPDHADPDTVAERALSALFSWQPATDVSPGSAGQRAVPWLGGQLAASAAQPPAANVRLLPQWQGWKDSGDIISSTATADGALVTTEDKVILPVTVTQTVLHRDGSSTPYATNTIRATVEHTADGWRLTEYNITPN